MNREAVLRQQNWAKLVRNERRLGSEAYLPPRARVVAQEGRAFISATKSQWAQATLSLLGEKYRLNRFHEEEDLARAKDATELRGVDPEAYNQAIKDLRRFANQERRDYLFPIYDCADKMILLKCGRQVEKSTLISVLAVVEPIVIDFFRTLYVSPSSLQTRTFSNEKLKPLIQYSHMIQKYWRNSSCRDQVFEQSFVNGSFVFLRYAFLTADRARGIPADRLCIDELQDILSENIRVIEECLSHSKWRYSLYAGTPKTLENTIEEYWHHSTQSEWEVKCFGCNKWNFLDVDCVGDAGPICSKCGRAIDPKNGVWVDHAPGKKYRGFRIPQLMVPWKYGDPDIWRSEIVYKLDNYSEAEFHNEVLGVSFDNASKPLSREDLVRCCWPSVKPPRINLESMIRNPRMQPSLLTSNIFLGVDWGEGQGGRSPTGKIKKPSFTVVSIGYVWNNTLVIVYQKRYEGREALKEFVFQDVVRLCRIYNVKMVGADRGHGWGINSDLMKEFKNRPKVCQFQYVSQNSPARFDEGAWAYMVDRTFQMTETIRAFKRQEVALASWDEAKEFLIDAEQLYADYRSSTKGKNELYYDHTGPDDAFQSICYLRMAAMVYYGRLIPRESMGRGAINKS